MNNLFKQLILLLLANGLLSSSIYAKECPRGTLSKQFCDEDGDLMADTPKNKKEWLNPYTLVFGNTPNQSFVFYDDAREKLIQHIQKVTGKKVVFFPYQTNAAELEAMKSGILHIAGMNTGSVPTAINCAGFHLFAMTGSHNDVFGYKMQIITYPNSGINSIKDIKDNTVLFTSSSSNSGHKAPVALLKQKFGLIHGIDYKSRFSGRHSKSIKKIVNHEYKIAAVSNGIREGMITQGKIPKGSTKVLYESKSFPTTGYGYSNKLDPTLASKIELAFKTFRFKDKNGTIKVFNKYGEDHFMDADYINKWKIIRDINKANNITYECQ